MATDSRARIDKWLWAARFYKTRTLASKACELGRVEFNGQRVKAAREVRVGDKLRVATEGGDFEIEVLAISEDRGPASAARELYSESDESREKRRHAAEERKLLHHFEELPAGRPSKHDRRTRLRLRGRP